MLTSGGGVGIVRGMNKKTYMEDSTGRTYRVLSYPYGGAVRVEDVISKAVYTVALYELKEVTYA